MKTSRRSFIKKSAAAAAVTLAGRTLFPSFLRARTGAAGNPLRMLPDFTGGALTAAPGTAELRPGSLTDIYGLNGSYLGPTIRVRNGDTFAAQLRNRLADEDLILHWHGLFAPEAMDGHPHYAIGPGENYDYSFPIFQRAATCWYHSHTDMMTAPQVYKGLAGLFIIHDDEEQGLGLPAGEYDVALVIQDKRVTDDFQFEYKPTSVDKMRGWQGDTILVNGTPDALLSVAPTLYRFRLLNGANARVWKIGFADGRSFHLIAGDGGLLDAPIEVDSFFLPPGARAEILVDFSGDAPGAQPLLQSLEYESGESVPGTRQGKPADLIGFPVERPGNSGGSIPQTLSTVPRLEPAAAVRTRNFMTHMFDGRHAINDLVFEMMRIDFEVPMGELEMWEFFNPSQQIHPMHVHGVHFQVVSRNGSPQVMPEERGWKDTVLLFPYDRVQVLLRFDAYPGMFMLHCHNLEHEDDGMMMNFRVTPPSSVNETDRSTGALRAWPNPASERTVLRFAPASNERELVVADELGRTVMRRMIPAGSDRANLRVSSLASGRYWCRIGSEAVMLAVVR